MPIKCDDCGKFISYDDFENGAKRTMSSLDNHFSGENWETVCIKCNSDIK